MSVHQPGGKGGTISDITSVGATITITDPHGPTTNLETTGGGSGTVTAVSSANTSIAVATGTTTPVLTVATLDVLATNGPPAAAVAMNGKKITGLANGSAPTDAAAYGQVTALVTGVSSVFTRTGAVTAQSGDYTDLQVTGSPTNVLTTTGDLLYASGANTLARLGIGSGSQLLGISGGVPAWVAAPASGVSSFNTRTGAVVPVTADYYGIVAAALTGVTGGAARFVGSLAVGAAPGSGTFLTGDFTVNQDGSVWVCTAGGSPGTWVNAASLIPAGTVTNAMIASAAGISISKLADPGAGKVIGSNSGAAAVFPPGYEIGYTQVTSTVNVTDTSESTATAVVSPGALAFDGAPVIVTFFCPEVIPPSGTSGSLVVTIFEGATQIGRLAVIENEVVALQLIVPILTQYRFTPTAGNHTYKISAFVNATTGTPQLVCGAGGTATNVPMFVRFTKV